MSTEEQRRTEVLTKLLSDHLDRPQACLLLGVSDRTLTRLRARFVAGGAAGIIHGNRGRTPVNRTEDGMLARLRVLAAPDGIYGDFNVCHLQQTLARVECLVISRSTLDRLLREHGIRKPPRKQKRRVFARRERMAQEGMMLQLDGSQHDWLEGRGTRLCLVGAVDDATGKLVHARFHPQETQDAYIRMIRQIALEHGLPMSVYHDKHTILRSPKAATIEDELAGREPMSQVQRMLSELGIESIAANTPQAKGRIERLWCTLQDRLTREMRLANVSTMDEANAFLSAFVPTFNTDFGRPAADPESAWVKAPGLDLPYYFCVREQRVARKDHTLSFQGETLHLTTGASVAGKKLHVHRTPEGDLFVYDGKRCLPCRTVAAPASRPSQIPQTTIAMPPQTTIAMPPSDTQKPHKPGRTQAQRAWLYAGAAGSRPRHGSVEQGRPARHAAPGAHGV